MELRTLRQTQEHEVFQRRGIRTVTRYREVKWDRFESVRWL